MKPVKRNKKYFDKRKNKKLMDFDEKEEEDKNNYGKDNN